MEGGKAISRTLGSPGASTRAFLNRHADLVALGLIVLVGLALRVAFTLRAPVMIQHDSVAYFRAGYELAHGLGFELTYKRTPLYSFFIAGTVALLGDDLRRLIFVQHLLGLLTAVLTYLLGHALFNRSAGLIGGLSVALSGPLLVAEHYLLAEALFIMLMVAFGLTLVTAVRRARAKPSVVGGHRKSLLPALGLLLLAGLLLGLAGLTRPIGQVGLPVVLITLLLGVKPWRRATLAFLVVGVGLAAVTLPWLGRNYLQHGTWSSDGALGLSLIGRLTRHDDGYFFVPPSDPSGKIRLFTFPDSASPSPASDPLQSGARTTVLRMMANKALPSQIQTRLMREYGWTERQASQAMRDVAFEVILANRGHYVGTTLAEVVHILWGNPETKLWPEEDEYANKTKDDWLESPSIAHLLPSPPAPDSPRRRDAAAIASIFSPYELRWPLLALLVLGVVRGLRSTNRWATGFIILLTLALVAPAAALVGFVPRYRYPADPFLLVLIGAGLTWLVQTTAAMYRSTWTPGSLNRATRKPSTG